MEKMIRFCVYLCLLGMNMAYFNAYAMFNCCKKEKREQATFQINFKIYGPYTANKLCGDDNYKKSDQAKYKNINNDSKKRLIEYVNAIEGDSDVKEYVNMLWQSAYHEAEYKIIEIMKSTDQIKKIIGFYIYYCHHDILQQLKQSSKPYTDRLWNMCITNITKPKQITDKEIEDNYKLVSRIHEIKQKYKSKHIIDYEHYIIYDLYLSILSIINPITDHLFKQKLHQDAECVSNYLVNHGIDDNDTVSLNAIINGKHPR